MSTLGARILVVEDENIVAMDLRASLTRLGYQVVETVGTGERAVERAGFHRPDLVLMDIQLRGEMDGIQAAEKLKLLDIPVVYLTAFSDDATLRRARVTEAYAYLLKPFDERELYIVAEMAIHRHRAQKEHDQLLREQAARAAVEKEHRWSRFLADAGRELSGSLDVTATLQSIVRLAVPALADWAVLHVRKGEGFELAAVHHPQGKEAALDELRKLPALPEAPAAGSQAIRVPLEVRGETWGILTLAWSEPGRRYRPDDAGHAAEWASRCALAVENARLYQAAKEAVSVRDEFLSIASHELRTPLSSLQLILQSMERTAAADSVLAPRIARALRQGGRLAHLIKSLLDVTRIKAGRLELEYQHIDLVEVVREVVDRFEEPAQHARSPLRLKLPERALAQGDRMRIEQVITNLLSNALKFGAGKPVELTVEDRGAEALLTVRDHGPGIALKDRTRIFGQFERAVSSRQFGGLGLGLYITREIVQAHGGSIEVESALDDGATFSVHLPKEPPAAEHPC